MTKEQLLREKQQLYNQATPESRQVMKAIDDLFEAQQKGLQELIAMKDDVLKKFDHVTNQLEKDLKETEERTARVNEKFSRLQYQYRF